MSVGAIRIERVGPVTRLTIDRPRVLNALDKAAQAELARAFDTFAADDEQRVAVLTGAGRAFCAGYDLGSDPEGEAGLPATGFGGITARFDLDKPVIAAVNGLAVGGGFEMVLACDIVVAASGAFFALPEVTVGLAALGGGVLRLPRVAGPQRALGMMLTGRRASAEEGLAMGFVTEVTEEGDVAAAAMRWAEMLLAAGPLASRATKAVARTFAHRDLEAAMREQWEHPAVKRLLASDEGREGPAAFREKRKPRWSPP